MNKEDILLSEFIGAIIGDGNLWSKNNHYRVEITGDPKLDKNYFRDFLIPVTKKLFNITPHVRIRQRGLRLRITSKKVYSLLIEEYNLPVGSKKGLNVTIPKQILDKKELFIACLRGIFDTDGSIFLADKGYRKDYPTIEITTTSSKLAKQIRNILIKLEYKFGFRSWKPKKFRKKWIISINGDKMVKKWMHEIGTNNTRHYINLNSNL